MEKKAMSLPDFLDALEGQAITLLANIRTAKEGAEIQSTSILALEAEVKDLKAKLAPPPPPPLG